MTKNTLPVIAIAMILAFAAGCTGESTNQKTENPPDRVADSLPANSTAQTGNADDLPGSITGHFIMTGTRCAGFNFISPSRALWTNEIACDDPDTLAIRWLDNKTFMAKSTRRINENCPPRVDIYKVVSFDNKHLVLQSVWTGWNDLKDETLEFDKQAK